MNHDTKNRPEFGISAALTTPFDSAGRLDTGRAGAHLADLVGRGLKRVTLGGTTGEGASLSFADRRALLDTALEVMPGPEGVTLCVCAPDVETAADQVALGVERGVSTFLVTPPFYFKGVDELALAAWFTSLARTTADEARFILYHIPQVTAVAITPALVRALTDTFGPRVMGVKDSSGDWEGTKRFLDETEVAILVGDERQLAKAARIGASGSICGMANLSPERMDRIARGEEDADMNALVSALVAHPVTPMVKAMVAAKRSDAGWIAVRPPLSPANSSAAESLLPLLERIGGGS